MRPSIVEVMTFPYDVSFDNLLLPQVKVSKSPKKIFASDVEASGIVHHDSQSIIIDGRMGPDYQAEVLLHEVLHICFYLTNTFDDSYLEEKAVRTLSPVLLSMLRQNPELVGFLLHPKEE